MSPARDIAAWYLRTGVTIVILGMALGLFMATREDFTLMPVHAHMNVIGWLSFFVIGLYYRTHPEAATGRLPVIQFWCLLCGIALMAVSLAVLVTAGGAIWGPLAGLSGVLLIAGMGMFAVTVWGQRGVVAV